MIPVNTDWMKSQMEHQPTYDYMVDMYNLAKKFPFKNALEIGCMWGISTLALLTGSEGKLVSVDKSTYTHAAEETSRAKYSERWTFINMDSAKYWEQRQDTFDLVYIDGNHSYEYAHLDIREGWKAVKEGGVLAIDDVTHKNNRPDSSDPYGVAIASWEHIYNNQIKEYGFIGRILWLSK